MVPGKAGSSNWKKSSALCCTRKDGLNVAIAYHIDQLQEKMFIATKKAIAITLKSLQ